VIASDVEGAGINWGKPDQKMLRKVPLAEMEKYIQQGQFPAGSMGPKVDAVMQFTQASGNRGVICQLKDIEKAIAGEAGTEIVK
jgi:carbamate kinase